jgi:hypothetical protein
VALASYALTTVARLCRRLGIAEPTPGSTAEADLHHEINSASSAIARYCDRSFVKGTVTEKVRGYGNDTLRLSRYPLISITSVSLSGSSVDANAWATTPEQEDAEAGLLRHLTDSWEWTADYQVGASPELRTGTERPSYSVVYVGGYVLPGAATELSPQTLPPELEEACLLTCVAMYRSRGRDQSVLSESLLSASRTYAGSTANTAIGRGLGGIIPDAVVPQLDRFKRWV